MICVARHSRHSQNSTDFSAVLHIANVMVSCFINQIVKLKIKIKWKEKKVTIGYTYLALIILVTKDGMLRDGTVVHFGTMDNHIMKIVFHK